MGELPLYLRHIQTKDMHRGLLFDKFFYYSTLGEKAGENDKKGFLQNFKGSCGDAESIKSYATKQLNLIESIGGTAMIFSTQWHFVTGMGIDHPLENGMAWHHTLGTPYIAGSGVKGMFRAYLWEWSDVQKEQIQQMQQILRWCGYTKEEGKKYGLKGESTGTLIFFDAIPVEPVILAPDVMTPHMGDWYEKGGEEQHNADNPPADWYNPVPVLFLAVKKASFLFGIAPRNEEVKADLKDAMEYLGEALKFVGAGAKTAAGYGRFDKAENHKFLTQYQKDKEQANKIALEREKAKELEKLSPVDRIFAQIGDDIANLIKALEEDKFGDDRKNAALKIKELMESKKDWDPNGDPNKSKSAKRTKKVQKFLGE